MNGILPVFVLEGTAPVLKHNVIRQRNNLRKDRKEKNTKSQQSTAKNGGRSNAFNATIKECEMMLQFMGLECVRAYGEAEAMCAYLNADGVRKYLNLILFCLFYFIDFSFFYFSWLMDALHKIQIVFFMVLKQFIEILL